ncbi:hypothetical protein SMSP2_01648 [Limihaloglobus sulfuriphilus]|uniref:Uncharacterized protein n=1 Tax=Limihaloglobus sulfuriphilus TaxID=1851148 RepID=A0A1Q2MFF0_9BACT|nr:hypothetical protein [Limihaloglobus sulfuriphilus]AQQ71278.1 hypothetical protein SMSP2_01648 [Limihaloglobus sulfuriphilus]
MNRIFVFIIAHALLLSSLKADTFTHKPTSNTFDGYATQIKKLDKTLVRIGYSGRYYDLSEFDIEYNARGRRNEVHLIPINTRFYLNSQAVEFRNQLELSLNRGPLAIIIPVSSSGGDPQICLELIDLIAAAENTPVYIWINREYQQGALEEAAFVALCSDNIYMQSGSIISGIKPEQESEQNSSITQGGYQPIKDILTLIFKNRQFPGVFLEGLFNPDTRIIKTTINGKNEYKSFVSEDIPSAFLFAETIKPEGEAFLLTSSQAMEAGLIDGVSADRGGFFDAIGIPDSAEIKTFDVVSEIERAFTNAEKRVNSKLRECRFLAEQIGEGRKQLEIISAEYRQAKLRRTRGSFYRSAGGNIYYPRGSSYPSGWEHYKYVRDRRENAIRNLMRQTDSLIAAMDEILSIWLRYPELNGDIETARQRIMQYQQLYDQLNYME